MIAQASVQEVINRADVVEIVGQFVRLKKRGTNYIANCPFHNEKTPSFSVSSTKGIYKCFGCGKGGNSVTFIQDHEKLTFPEAIKWLADFYKIELVESERSPEQLASQQTEESLRILNDFAATWFTQTLLNTEEGKAVGLSYFKQRGLRKETIETFRLGYCPEGGDDFYKAAVAAGYSGELLEKAGLVKERNGAYRDNYRGRVIFPILSPTGRVLGFGARILKSNDKAPKYINTPETELYVKSRVLYGLYTARQSIGKRDECLLTEGYLDVISLHQSGIENSVASSGTALTEDQLRAIGQLTKNLTILYDSDAAGIKAALRGLDMALSQSFNVQLALLPEGEDPDSFVQKHGRSGFEEYVKAHKQDVVGFRMEIGAREAGDDPVKKNALVNEIAETISRINKAEDFSLQQHYSREAVRRLGVDEGGFITLVNKYIRDHADAERRTAGRASSEQSTPNAPVTENDPEAQPEIKIEKAQERQEWQLIRVLLEHGAKPCVSHNTISGLVKDRVDADLIETPLAKRFWDLYFDFEHQHDGGQPTAQFFTNFEDADVQQKAAMLLHNNDEISVNWKERFGIESIHGEENYINDAESTLAYFELKKLKLVQAELTQRIQSEKDENRLVVISQHYLMTKQQEKEILQKHGTVIVKS